jgi:hypothetical protein
MRPLERCEARPEPVRVLGWLVEKPTLENFTVWRDSSETAHRWHRTLRLAGKGPESPEDELDEILGN